MYDRWSQYRPYQRGDPSTCKPIFEVCPKAGECDPATQYCDCTTYDDCENEPTAAALKAWYMGVSAGFDGAGTTSGSTRSAERTTRMSRGASGRSREKAIARRQRPVLLMMRTATMTTTQSRALMTSTISLAQGSTPILTAKITSTRTPSNSTSAQRSTFKFSVAQVIVLSPMGPSKTRAEAKTSYSRTKYGKDKATKQQHSTAMPSALGALRPTSRKSTRIWHSMPKRVQYNSGNPIQHRFYDHTVPDPSTAPIDLPDAYFLYQQRGLRGDIIKMRQLLSGKDHDTFDADLPCFKDVTIESRRVGSAQDNPRDTSTLNDIQAKSALTMTYELGTGKFAAEFILRATGGEGRNMLLGGKAEDVLCPFSPPPSAPPPLPSAPPSPPLPCPPPPECLAETRVFDSDGNPPVGVECSADYFCDPGLMARGGDLEHVSLDVMSANPPEWISPTTTTGGKTATTRWKVVWMRQGTLRNYGPHPNRIGVVRTPSANLESSRTRTLPSARRRSRTAAPPKPTGLRRI